MRRPATAIAREAIERWLAEQHRATQHDAIVGYARGSAGTASDLDVDHEAAAIEHLSVKVAQGLSLT